MHRAWWLYLSLSVSISPTVESLKYIFLSMYHLCRRGYGSVQCTLLCGVHWTVQCAVGFSTVWYVQQKKFKWHFAVNVQLLSMIPCSVQCSVCSVQYAVCSVQCAVCRVQCAVWKLQCAVCRVQCAVCSVQSAVEYLHDSNTRLPLLSRDSRTDLDNDIVEFSKFISGHTYFKLKFTLKKISSLRWQTYCFRGFYLNIHTYRKVKKGLKTQNMFCFFWFIYRRSQKEGLILQKIYKVNKKYLKF